MCLPLFEKANLKNKKGQNAGMRSAPFFALAAVLPILNAVLSISNFTAKEQIFSLFWRGKLRILCAETVSFLFL